MTWVWLIGVGNPEFLKPVALIKPVLNLSISYASMP
jgi:hypothetical protein